MVATRHIDQHIHPNTYDSGSLNFRHESDADYYFGNARSPVAASNTCGTAPAPYIPLLRDALKLATRAACSLITRALFSFSAPAGWPRIIKFGLDHMGRRGHPPQLSL